MLFSFSTASTRFSAWFRRTSTTRKWSTSRSRGSGRCSSASVPNKKRVLDKSYNKLNRKAAVPIEKLPLHGASRSPRGGDLIGRELSYLSDKISPLSLITNVFLTPSLVLIIKAYSCWSFFPELTTVYSG